MYVFSSFTLNGQFIVIPARKGSTPTTSGSSSFATSSSLADAKDSSGSKMGMGSNGKGNNRIRNGRDGSPGTAELRIKKESGE